MSTALVSALAIETGLQLLNRGPGQDQGLVAHDVVNVGTDRREQVHAREVRRSVREADVQRVAVDHQRGLAEAQLAELLDQRLGLAFSHVEVVDDDQLTALSLAAQRHLETERTDLLVQREREQAGARAVGLAAADEDRGAAIAVTSRTAAL